MAKKIIVTGGAGFIGSHIVDALVARGDEVFIIDNFAGGRREDRINSQANLLEIDVRDLGALREACKGASGVFHLAALPRVQYSIEHPEETGDVNINGTRNVLIAAHEAGVERVVYSASSSAYGDQETLPLVEDMKADPKSPYGLQKYVGELYCRTWAQVYGLETVSLRYFNIYGSRYDSEGAYALVIGKFLKQRKEGRPLVLYGDGSQTRDFTHVRDAVRANLLAMDAPSVGRGEVINIGAGRNFSIAQVAALVGGEVVHEPARLEPHDTLADNTLARTLLAWEPQVELEEGIAELKAEIGLA